MPGKVRGRGATHRIHEWAMVVMARGQRARGIRGSRLLSKTKLTVRYTRYIFEETHVCRALYLPSTRRASMYDNYGLYGNCAPGAVQAYTGSRNIQYCSTFAEQDPVEKNAFPDIFGNPQ